MNSRGLRPVPGAEAILAKLWSSSSSGSRLRSVQSRHWLGNRVLRMGSLLRTWSLVTAGRRDRQSHQLRAWEAPRAPGRSPSPGWAGPGETCLWLPLAALRGSAQMGEPGAGQEETPPLERPWTSPQPSFRPPFRTHTSSSEPRNGWRSDAHSLGLGEVDMFPPPTRAEPRLLPRPAAGPLPPSCCCCVPITGREPQEVQRGWEGGSWRPSSPWLRAGGQTSSSSWVRGWWYV